MAAADNAHANAVSMLKIIIYNYNVCGPSLVIERAHLEFWTFFGLCVRVHVCAHVLLRIGLLD